MPKSRRWSGPLFVSQSPPNITDVQHLNVVNKLKTAKNTNEIIEAQVKNLFSEPEIEYLKTQRLLRIATASREGQPDVVPVAFEFDGQYFWVGSHSQEIFHHTHKYKNVRDGNKLISLVIDDLESVDPWRPRCIKVYGTAEIMDHQGIFGPGKYLRIAPKISWSMGTIKGLKPKEGEFRVKTIHT